MNKFILIILLVFLENPFLVESSKEDDLVSVIVLFRHGDKIPEHSFPTDKFFKFVNFPMGFGQLTNKGKKRHYDLGQWLRNRYRDFLPTLYSPDDILVRSTDVDRTLMSAAVNLAGLYPPVGNQVWMKDLLWQPIPVHTVEQSEEAVLAMMKACPKLEALHEESKKSEFYQNINKEYSELYEYLSKQTGMDVKDVDTVRLIQSLFYCYSNYNSSYIPSWADNLNQTAMEYLSALSYSSYTFTDNLKRLRVGPFFDYLFGYLDRISSNASNTPKFLMLSSHDSELASFMNAMGAYDFQWPGFAASLIWEVRRDGQGKDYVNLFYKNSDGELSSLTVKGCALDCQLDDYKKIMEHYTVNENTWEAECSS